MKKVLLESNEDDIHIDCPYCDMWEQLGVDDPRKRLNVLPIIKWLPDAEHEESVHECTQCKNQFIVVWDYDNPITVGAR